MSAQKITLSQVAGLPAALDTANAATANNAAAIATNTSAIANTNANVATLTGSLTSTNANVATVANTATFTANGYQTVTPVTITGNAANFDLAGSNADFKVTHDANLTTISYSGFPPAGTLKSWTIRVVGTGTARTWTWPTTPTIRHNGGTAPTINSTNGKITTITQWTDDGGATIHSFKSGET